jgi:hypothetical protein
VSPADRPCSPLCWGAPLYVRTPHAGQHAQSYVDSSGAQFPNCQDGGNANNYHTICGFDRIWLQKYQRDFQQASDQSSPTL